MELPKAHKECKPDEPELSVEIVVACQKNTSYFVSHSDFVMKVLELEFVEAASAAISVWKEKLIDSAAVKLIIPLDAVLQPTDMNENLNLTRENFIPCELKTTRGEKRYFINNTNIMKIKSLRDEQTRSAWLEQDTAGIGDNED